MAVNIDLIRAYTDGLVAVTDRGVIDATLPTDGVSELDAAFKEIGAVTDDGITEATNQDRNDIFIWQGNALARRVPGAASKEFTFAAAETNLTTLGIHFTGSTITQTAEGVTVQERPPGADIRNWVLHYIDGNRALRIVVPRGEVTSRGELIASGQGISVYQWTLSAYVDPSGFWAYRYYVDLALATPGGGG